MPPQILYFDLGNVLLGFSHERMCTQMADVAGLSVEIVRDLLFADEGPDCVQWQIEDGRIGVDGYYAHFCQRTSTRPDRLRLEWAAADIFWPLESSVELLRSLAGAGNRLGLLSNINPLHWQFVSDGKYPWLQPPGRAGSLFSSVVLSYEVGVMKPDRQIYEAAAAEAGVAPQNVFYTDDREENVRGALTAGLDAVLFVHVEQLRANLRARGVAGA
jgi:putative hydrolase of the HAD superfamily